MGNFVGLTKENVSAEFEGIQPTPSDGKNFVDTVDAVTVKHWVRRGAGNNVFYALPNDAAYCGAMALGKKSYRGCLSMKKAVDTPDVELEHIGGTVIDFRSNHAIFTNYGGTAYSGGVVEQTPGKFVGIGASCGWYEGANSPTESLVPANCTWFVFRYLNDGSRDPTFGDMGMVRENLGGKNSGPFASRIAVLPDTKILVAGGTTTHGEGVYEWNKGTFRFLLMKYEKDGVIDKSFGTQGKVDVTHPLYELTTGAELMVVQSDGKIILGGTIHIRDRIYVSTFTRINANGTTDTGFGQGGWADLTGTTDWPEIMHDIKLQSDGKMVMAGAYRNINDQSYSLIPYYPVWRLNSNGSRDSSFGKNGRVQLTIPQFKWQQPGDTGVNYYRFGPEPHQFGFRAVEVLSDGKILLSGGMRTGGTETGTDGLLVRLSSDGAFDPSFGTNGVVTVDTLSTYPMRKSEEYFRQFYVLPSTGKIVSFGVKYATSEGGSSPVGLLVARHNIDGSPDLSFGTGGSKIIRTVALSDRHTFLPQGTSLNESWLIPRSISSTSDGKLLLVGTGRYDPFVVRTDLDFNPDSSFGTAGWKWIALPHSQDFGASVAFQGESRIIVGGTSYPSAGTSMGTSDVRPVLAAIKTSNATLDVDWGGASR